MLEYPQMPDESNELPTSRVVRWVALGVLIFVAVALYFRDGRRIPSLTETPAAVPSAEPGTR